MRVIFPNSSTHNFKVDEVYEEEMRAAKDMGFSVSLLSFDSFVQYQNAWNATAWIKGDDELAIYRGWMLPDNLYAALYSALIARGLKLINNPIQQKNGHLFPRSYPALKDMTPLSVCIPFHELDWDTIRERLQVFGEKPLILKDWVKSEKHYWEEACFIPCAGDIPCVKDVVYEFMQRRGESFTGGLVFREFEDFVKVGTHPISRMPLSMEARLFFVHGQQIAVGRYWPIEYEVPSLPSLLSSVANRIECPFLTMDVALRTDGKWRVIEVGDGQVSDLPDDADKMKFYEGLRNLARVEP